MDLKVFFVAPKQNEKSPFYPVVVDRHFVVVVFRSREKLLGEDIQKMKEMTSQEVFDMKGGRNTLIAVNVDPDGIIAGVAAYRDRKTVKIREGIGRKKGGDFFLDLGEKKIVFSFETGKPPLIPLYNGQADVSMAVPDKMVNLVVAIKKKARWPIFQGRE